MKTFPFEFKGRLKEEAIQLLTQVNALLPLPILYLIQFFATPMCQMYNKLLQINQDCKLNFVLKKRLILKYLAFRILDTNEIGRESFTAQAYHLSLLRQCTYPLRAYLLTGPMNLAVGLINFLFKNILFNLWVSLYDPSNMLNGRSSITSVGGVLALRKFFSNLRD